MIKFPHRSAAPEDASGSPQEAAAELLFPDLPPRLACAQVNTEQAGQISAARLTDLALRQALIAAGAEPGIIATAIDRPREAAPRLTGENPDRWQLSLSHSGPQLVAAAAQGLSIGVDTELHRDRDIARLTGFLRWNSGADGSGGSLTRQAFYLRWTLAEALFKAGAAASAACYSVANQSLSATPPELVPAGSLAAAAGIDVATTGHRLTIAGRLWEARYRCDPESPATSAGTSTTCVVWSADQ